MPGIDPFKKITYSSRIAMAAQQQNTRLSVTTMDEPITGEQRRWRAYGAIEMQQIIGRAAPTNWQEMVRLQRTITHKRFGFPVLLDPKADSIDMDGMFEPNDPFYQTIMAGAARQRDREIISAYDGIAYAGDEGTTATSFSGAQDIAAGGTGFLLTKLRDAKKLLDNAEYPTEDRYLALSPDALQQLIFDVTTLGANNVPPMMSMDTGNSKALIKGAEMYFMGFNFITTALIPTNTAGANRYAYAYHKSAIVSGGSDNAEIFEGEIPERNFAKGVAVYLYTAATRVFENGIVRINSIV